MAVKLSGKDHVLLDKFLEHVLDQYKNGVKDRMSAREILVEAFALIAKDNGNVVHYMQAALDRDPEDDL